MSKAKEWKDGKGKEIKKDLEGQPMYSESGTVKALVDIDGNLAIAANRFDDPLKFRDWLTGQFE